MQHHSLKRSGPDAGHEAANHKHRIGNSSALSGYRALAGKTPSRPSIDVILGRLDGVKRSGRGWVAKCPAHADRSPSLSIAEGDEGRILIKCFASCDVTDVLTALGLDFQDLFPERVRDLSPLGRAQRREAVRVANAVAAANVLALEAGIVQIAAADTAQGKPLANTDRDRLTQAIDCIEAAQRILNDKPPSELHEPVNEDHYRRLAASLHQGAEQAANYRARVRARLKGLAE
jgi:hypothetical protein